MTIVHRDVRIGVSGLLAVALAAATHSIANAEDGGFAGFEPPVLYDLPSPASSIRAGDLDGDGDVDLVFAHPGGHSVSILFNNGDGTFEPGPDMLVAIAMEDTAITDFDGDGIMDIIAVSQGSPVGEPFDNVGRVAILRGLGGGVFDEPVFYFAGFQPVGVAAGDLNGDGHPDFAVTNQLSNDVAVFLNGGDGEPDEPVLYNVGGEPQSIVIDDMNLDAHSDLIVLNRLSANISVLHNDGTGAFSNAPSIPTVVSGNRELSVGDFNGDLFPDVALSTGSLGAIRIHFNTDGELAAFEVLDAGIGNTSLGIAQFGAQPSLDIAPAGFQLPNLAQSVLGLLLGNGHGEFQVVDDVFAIADSSVLPTRQATADFNGDANIDVAAVVGSQVAVLLNATAASLPDLTDDGLVNSADLAVLLRAWGQPGAADFDKSGAVDGKDLAHLLANWDHPAPRDVPAALPSSAPQPAPVVRRTITADLNGDDRADRVELLESPASPHRDAQWSITVWVTDDDGPPRLVSTLSSELFRYPTDMRLSDVNDDGHLDLLIADPEAGFLVRFFGVPHRGFDFLATGEPFLTGDAATVREAARRLLAHNPSPEDWLRRLAEEPDDVQHDDGGQP